MRRLVVLFVPFLLAACTALPKDPSDTAGTAEYRTGSNIPQRDRSLQIENKSIDQTQIPRNTIPRSGG